MYTEISIWVYNKLRTLKFLDVKQFLDVNLIKDINYKSLLLNINQGKEWMFCDIIIKIHNDYKYSESVLHSRISITDKM